MRRPAILLACLCAMFLGATVYRAAMRPLWYDELFTFYLTGMPLERFAGAMKDGLDLNPPLIYASTWATQVLFGANELGARMPAVLGFLVAMLAVYGFAAQRMAPPFALAAVSILPLTGAYPFALEARSYGLLLGFTGLALFFWQRAAEPRRRHRDLAGLSLSVLAALLTHCYALLPLAALGLGELARTLRSRRFDLGVWLAGLLAPGVGILVVYVPLLSNSKKAKLAGPIFDPSVIRLMASYGDLLMPALPAIALGLIAVAVASRAQKGLAAVDGTRIGFLPHEWAALAGLAAAPVMAFILSTVTGGGYFTRYGLGAAITLACVWGALCQRAWRASPGAAAVLPLMAGAWFAFGFAGEMGREPAGNRRLPGWQAISEWKQRGSEPLVVLDGQTFLELDHYLDDSTAARLVFLLDHGSALRFMRTDCYDAAMRIGRPWFPLRGRVMEFDQFRAGHNGPALLFGKSQDEHEWLLDRLKADGIAYTVVAKSGGRQLVATAGGKQQTAAR